YSTMFAWYTSASAFVAMLALAILLVIFLKSRGYFELVNENHIHDLGKYLFAFSIFWTYLWFSQFMLIWYANIGEETIYFKERYNNYATLFFANIAINFLVPFIILMRNDTKRKVGTMTFVAIVVLLGHWLDFFLMIKPGTLITANHAMGVETEAVQGFVSGFTVPSLLDLGTFIGFLGLFVYVSLWIMSKAALTPKNDPYLEESVHHHVV
ncbi:MAG: quinol:cytochrome C oxidoreductase, partial [Chitinophagales bacterium]|nr:quinol:cytochrome C oxidoreductase [Chitinophagales bacterium]